MAGRKVWFVQGTIVNPLFNKSCWIGVEFLSWFHLWGLCCLYWYWYDCSSSFRWSLTSWFFRNYCGIVWDYVFLDSVSRSFTLIGLYVSNAPSRRALAKFVNNTCQRGWHWNLFRGIRISYCPRDKVALFPIAIVVIVCRHVYFEWWKHQTRRGWILVQGGSHFQGQLAKAHHATILLPLTTHRGGQCLFLRTICRRDYFSVRRPQNKKLMLIICISWIV